MYRCYQQEVNMGDNKKPILSVLVDEEKKRLFADLARAHNYSMGWLLNQAIDKMLEAGTIHIYRDSVIPIDGAIPNPLPSSDIEEVVRRYVDKANESIIDNLLNLQAQVTELTANRDNWNDLRADVADLREQLRQLTTTMAKKPQPIAKAASIGVTQPNPETMKMVGKLQRNPELRAVAEKGLAEGLKGKALCNWLFEQGYGANENTNAFNSSVASVLNLAIEHLKSLKNGA
jgi:hypothetical protein